MIKLASIFLSLLVFSQSLSSYVGTFAEVSTLLEHAKVHTDEYGDNFIVFLSKHYGELRDQHSQDDHDKEGDHDKLPFTHHNCSHTLVAVNDKAFSITLVKPLPAVDVRTNFSYLNLYASLEESGIFQPPKIS